MADTQNRDVDASPPTPAATEHDAGAQRLRDDIDKGKTRDKIAAPDPATAPLGTDSEASGNRTPEDVLKRPPPDAKPAGPSGHASDTPPGISRFKVVPGSFSDAASEIASRGWAVVLITAVLVIIVGLLLFAIVA